MDARTQLGEVFGFSEFRPGQEEIVTAVLEGREVLAVMPTGAGKSLCYQLPGTMLPGLTLVVSPLIALMKDQVDVLEARGIAATFINSSLSVVEGEARLAKVSAGEIDILYIAPERFRAAGFLEQLESVRLSLLAIDEAHCISQWGHDFRPDYTRLGTARARLRPERVAAFTATATQEVRADIVRELGFRDPLLSVHGFDRPELFFGAEQVRGKGQKEAAVLEALREMVRAHGDGASAIVYCATRKSTEAIAVSLQEEGFRAVAYHGGLPAAARDEAQERFMRGETPIIVATNAFGMGVDKADIRLVLHHDLPGSVEAYYQEAGRAGRDGLPAKAQLIWGMGDLRLRRRFIAMGAPTAGDVQKVWRRLRGPGGRGGRTLFGTEKDLARGAEVDRGVIRGVLALLEGAGHLRRETSEGDRLRLQLRDDVAAEGLRVDFAAPDRHRKLEEARLERMITYAGRALCRRRALLDYFGDPAGPKAGELCGGCDACEAAAVRGSAGVEISELARERVRSCLRLVDAFDAHFGRRKIIAALCGLEMPGLDRFGLDRHPEAASLEALGEEASTELVDRMQGAGLLRVVRDPYPMLGITPEGQAVLAGHTPVPDEVAFLADDHLLAQARASRPVARTPRRRRRRGSAEKRPRATEAPGPVDAILLEALRALRGKLAGEQGVPAYVVLHDKHLEAMAALHPKDAQALLEVPGMGEKRLERYGEQLLEVLRAHAGAPEMVEGLPAD